MRQLTLIAHLVATGAWIGVDVALVVLAVTSVATGDRRDCWPWSSRGDASGAPDAVSRTAVHR
ncbi:hypothetical protein BGP79_08835 [Tersicoccus sp. Bi-70]|nr:hypothetical protein BGP79_08835 [Tersicoccus sp. Bi-70]